jgi:hypothetical protein
MYARRTNRLTHALRAIAFACGGEAGAQLAKHLRMLISPDTLLRLIRSNSFSEMATPRVLASTTLLYAEVSGMDQFWWTWKNTVRWICWKDGRQKD